MRGAEVGIRQEAGMGNFVETWKGIAFAVSRSERWCRYMARRSEDPLPVFKVGGIVRLDKVDLDGWVARQRTRGFAETQLRLSVAVA
jgi:hypothetical protein